MKGKAKRLLAFFLCLLMLFSVMVIPTFAQSKQSSSSGSSTSNKTSISDVSAILNALSYDEYIENVLSRYATAGIAIFYGADGNEVARATLKDGALDVITIGGDDYTLKKEALKSNKKAPAGIVGTYNTEKKDVTVTVNKDETAKIVANGTEIDATYLVDNTIVITTSPNSAKVNEFDILDGIFTKLDGTSEALDSVVSNNGEESFKYYISDTKCDEPSDDEKNDGVLLGANGTVTWTFNVPEEYAGNYTIEIVYCQADDQIIDKNAADDYDRTGTSNAIERIFYLNGEFPFAETRTLVLNKVWEYDYAKDANDKNTFRNEDKEKGKGDDIRPAVFKDPTWVNYTISDPDGYYVNPFEFYFKAGENTISLEGQREDLIVQSIVLRPYEAPISYKEYIAQMEELHGKVEDNRPGEGVYDKQQAEETLNVSAITMYPVYDRTSAITEGLTGPQSESQVKYNTAGKEQWQNVGEWMSYTIDVPESGYYSIAVRYKQALLSGMYVSRKLYIDDEVPFAEAANCRFQYSSSWETCFLNDGTTEFEFYLEKGKHEIKLEATLGEMGEQIKQVSESLNNINNCYLEILKLTGTDPDANRSYGFTRVMPDVLKVMLMEAQNLEEVYNYLVAANKKAGGTGEGEKTATIKQVYQLLEKMATNESEIPANLATLKSQIGSMGTWINSAKTQPLQVDYYRIQSHEEELPDADAGFFKALWFEIKLFFASFVGNNYDEQKSSAEGVDEVIDVWVVTGRDQAQIIRNLIENNFTPEAVYLDLDENGEAEAINIGVNIKLIAGGTLLPSIIAGVGPEVSLMEASSTIIDYALRNAIKPLNDYVNEDIKSDIDNGYADYVNGSVVYKTNENGEIVYKDEAANILLQIPDAALEPLTLYNFGYDGEDDDEKYDWIEDSDPYLWRDGPNYLIDTNGDGEDDDRRYGYGWQEKNNDGKVEKRGIELYAMPDSLTFSMMFYREDVLSSLEIEPPTTWDGMLSILPILQYNNMEIGIQNDAYTFIYQNGNEAYSNNGMTINFDSKGVLNSFEQLCNYYTQYSLPYTYDFANRFRTGEMPIGIAAYTTCNQLAVFASELSGLWTFVQLPGQPVYDEDGNVTSINRSAVATVTGTVMIDNGDSKDQQKKDLCAWEFMKWYIGKDFQADYSNEIVSIMGIAARPATANRDALADLPWTAKEEANIMAQFNELVAVPNHPGSYYLARYVNFAFLATYNDGKDASDALLSYVTTINSELARRREEFGMITYDEYLSRNPNGELTND
ncbi:MAG: hypothetical protein IJD89_01270 [Clostridia bacterium]|nr:hypothetical protein [Clostridia bacterium]